MTKYYQKKLSSLENERAIWLSKLSDLEQRLIQRESELTKDHGQSSQVHNSQSQTPAQASGAAIQGSSGRAYSAASLWPSAADIAERAALHSQLESPAATFALAAAAAAAAAPVDAGTGTSHQASLPSQVLASGPGRPAGAAALSASIGIDVERRELLYDIDRASALQAQLQSANRTIADLQNKVFELDRKLAASTREYLLLRHIYHRNEVKAAEALAEAVAARQAAEREAVAVKHACANEVQRAKAEADNHARSLSSYVARSTQQHASDLKAQAAGYQARLSALSSQVAKLEDSLAAERRKTEAADARRIREAAALRNDIERLRVRLKQLEGRRFSIDAIDHNSYGAHHMVLNSSLVGNEAADASFHNVRLLRAEMGKFTQGRMRSERTHREVGGPAWQSVMRGEVNEGGRLPSEAADPAESDGGQLHAGADVTETAPLSSVDAEEQRSAARLLQQAEMATTAPDQQLDLTRAVVEEAGLQQEIRALRSRIASLKGDLGELG